MPAACRHVLDFGWRLTAPAIAEGRDAVYWQDGDGQVVGLAAWQQAWATLDFYVRPGPDAGNRRDQRDGERGRPRTRSAMTLSWISSVPPPISVGGRER